jgi:hypothetical protein
MAECYKVAAFDGQNKLSLEEEFASPAPKTEKESKSAAPRDTAVDVMAV